MSEMSVHQWMLEAAVLSLAAVWVCLSQQTHSPDVLLPPSLIPEHYDLSLDPRMDQGVFFGIVVITGLAIVETDVIVLHCKSLAINGTRVTDLTDEEAVVLEVVDIQQDLVLQQCHLHLNQSLKVEHEYSIHLEFMGFIGKDGIGLYIDFYMEGKNKHEILLTNDQPNFARAVFPCFDEPHFKAQFLLRVVDIGLPTMISNMPISHTTTNPEEDNRTWMEFEETPPMSTYLMIVVFCDYLALTDSETNTSVWAPRSRLHEAQLALNISVQALRQCQRYFGVEFSLPKLDHIPLSTINSVAMENWGAITYKKNVLLWEEGVSTWAEREMVTHVVTHEVIHQWVGNLVTTSWWNTTWLNEGVTSFFHFYIVDMIEPTWNGMDTTFVTQIQQILTDEAQRYLKPLTNNELLHQDTVFSQAFTPITYIKGAAIMRMVFYLMPPDVFREAVIEYISDNAFGAVNEEDLWQVLAAVTDLPESLEAVMYSWTHQTGFPLVTVHRSEEGCLTLTQSNYVASEESDVRWTIPITYTTSSELDFNVKNVTWFPDDQDRLELGVCLDPGEWVIVNIRQAGYYRVNYDTETWRALTYDLMNCDLSGIHPVNRAQLLNDGFDMARLSKLPYPTVLELTKYLVRETEYLPWAVAIQGLSLLRARLLESQYFPQFQQYALSLVEPEFSRISLTQPLQDLLPELHRRQIVEFACTLGHPRCVKKATKIAYRLMSGIPVSIPLDLKPVLLCAAVRHGQSEVWNHVLKEYQEASDNDRLKYLVALACSSDRDTIQRLLKEVADPLSFTKSVEERFVMFLEIGKQDNTLEDMLDMVLNMFLVELTENFDFEVMLNILKSAMKRPLNRNEKDKIYTLNHTIQSTKNKKHKDVMESILEEINSPDFKTLLEDPARVWFSQVLKEREEENEITSSSTVKPSQSEEVVTGTATPWEEDGSGEVSEESMNIETTFRTFTTASTGLTNTDVLSTLTPSTTMESSQSEEAVTMTTRWEEEDSDEVSEESKDIEANASAGLMNYSIILIITNILISLIKPN